MHLNTQRFALAQSLSLALLLCSLAACDNKQDAGAGSDNLNGAGSKADDAGKSAAASGKDAVGDAGKSAAGAGGKSDTGSAAGSGSAGKPAAAGAGGSAAGTGGGQAGTGAAGTGDKPVTAGKGGAGGKDAAGGAGAAGKGGTGGTSKRCGTRGGAMCADDQFCNFEPDKDCGATDKGGTCEDRPEVCTDIYAPVCGCDNRTHSSDCNAHGSGVSVKHKDACTAAECESAGGHTQLSNGGNTPMCKDNEDSWQISGTKDGGLCCLPRATSGKTCGGIANLQCGGGDEFCNYEESAGGQGCDGTVADAGGTCQLLPKGCTKDYRPVCGCDHKTYGNACTAHSDGMSVLHDGACTVSDCKAVGGRDVAGIGPPPMCNSNEHEFTSIVADNGSMAIEGMICCVK